MGKEFKILYWNIHFADGRSCKKETLDISSKIILDVISKLTLNTEVDAIVFTEAYPQLKDGKYNKMLYDYLKKKGFNIYPYDDKKYSVNDSYPFKNEDNKYTNGIFVATKNEFIIEDTSSCDPNYLLLRDNDKKLFLGALRICNYKAELYEKQIDVLKRKLNFNDNYKYILIGDFNPGSLRSDKVLVKNGYLSEKLIKHLREKYKNRKSGDTKEEINISRYYVNSKISHLIYDDDIFNCNIFDCESGTCINNKGEDTFPDKIFLLNCAKNEFVCEKTAEQVYFKEDYIVGGHVKNAKPGINLCKKNSLNEGASYLYNYSIKYKRFGLGVPAPFPDHNLLFASIDLGD